MSEEMEKPGEKPGKTCSVEGFNYCFWAKFTIGVPALGICGYMAAMQFENPLMQPVAWVSTVLFLVWAAIKVDNMPMMQKKVYTPKPKKLD